MFSLTSSVSTIPKNCLRLSIMMIWSWVALAKEGMEGLLLPFCRHSWNVITEDGNHVKTARAQWRHGPSQTSVNITKMCSSYAPISDFVMTTISFNCWINKGDAMPSIPSLEGQFPPLPPASSPLLYNLHVNLGSVQKEIWLIGPDLIYFLFLNIFLVSSYLIGLNLENAFCLSTAIVCLRGHAHWNKNMAALCFQECWHTTKSRWSQLYCRGDVLKSPKQRRQQVTLASQANER